MTMWEAVESVFHNYANFSGRARRSEYWIFFLFNFLAMVIFGVVASVAMDTRGTGSLFYRLWSGLGSLYSLGMLIPRMAVCWRRLHDTGHSGLHFFGPLALTVATVAAVAVRSVTGAPGGAAGRMATVFMLGQLVYGILFLVWLLREGTRGANKYGPDPKAEPEEKSEKAPWEL